MISIDGPVRATDVQPLALPFSATATAAAIPTTATSSAPQSLNSRLLQSVTGRRTDGQGDTRTAELMAADAEDAVRKEEELTSQRYRKFSFSGQLGEDWEQFLKDLQTTREYKVFMFCDSSMRLHVLRDRSDCRGKFRTCT